MSESRRDILEMLAKGQITADEAERLIALLEHEGAAGSAPGASDSRSKPAPKYLRVVVESEEGHKDSPTRVNVRVPMQLLRAGVRLASLIPAQARAEVNHALHTHGVQLDLSQIKPENLEELVDQLNELTVDVDQDGNKVRVFCE